MEYSFSDKFTGAHWLAVAIGLVVAWQFSLIGGLVIAALTVLDAAVRKKPIEAKGPLMLGLVLVLLVLGGIALFLLQYTV